MNLPVKKIENKNAIGFADQEKLIKLLGLEPSQAIPWSFSIQSVLDELKDDRDLINKGIDWGHHTGSKPDRAFEFDDALTAEVQRSNIDLRKGLPGYRSGDAPAPQSPPQTRKEVNESRKQRYFAASDEVGYYVSALTAAQGRERNPELRKYLTRYVLKTILTSVQQEQKGVRKTKTDRGFNRHTLTLEKIEAAIEDDEATIQIVMREFIVPPVRITKGKYFTTSKKRDNRTEFHKTAVLYIDWRRSRISDEQSRRGKTASFWRFMLNWIKEELFSELIEALIFGAFKGVSLAVKGIYKTAKYLGKARGAGRAVGLSLALRFGANAKELRRLMGSRHFRPDPVIDSAAVRKGQTLAPSGHNRATSPAQQGQLDTTRGTTPQSRRARETPDADDIALDRAFRGGADEGIYPTSTNLARGNTGERLATDVLVTRGHTVIDFKPSILGTNQGGIDMVTMKDGVVYLIDNKALSRGGNISSVSALTTNFAQNLRAVRRGLGQKLASHGTVGETRRVLQQAADALDNNSYVRVVTNMNVIAKGKGVTSGVTQNLFDQGIRFIDVVRD